MQRLFVQFQSAGARIASTAHPRHHNNCVAGVSPTTNVAKLAVFLLASAVYPRFSFSAPMLSAHSCGPRLAPIRSFTLRGGGERRMEVAEVASSNVNTPAPGTENEELLSLPPATGDPTKVTVNGASVSLEDEMGPLVVNGDGTLSRIANWAEMSPIERERTVRILGKRNKLRLEKLKAEATQGQPADQEKGLTKDSEAQVPGSTT